MKLVIMSAVAAFLATASLTAQTATTTVTTSTGTLHQFVPGSTFVVNEAAGPITYNYGPDVVYATRAGTVLTPAEVQTRIRAGIPVHVEYMPQGETRVIRRVLIDDVDDADDDDD